MSRNFREWSDIDINFRKRRSGEIEIARGEDAINQSIRIILSTILGEHVRSDIGSGLYGLLFEPMSYDIAEDMQLTIEENILQFEDRIILSRVKVQPHFDNHYYQVEVQYSMKSNRKKKTLTMYAPAMGVS